MMSRFHRKIFGLAVSMLAGGILYSADAYAQRSRMYDDVRGASPVYTRPVEDVRGGGKGGSSGAGNGGVIGGPAERAEETKSGSGGVIGGGAVPAARRDTAPLLSRFEAARNCREGVAYVYLGEPAPRWSCVGDLPNRRGPVRAVNITDPAETDIVIKRSSIWLTIEKCWAQTGYETLKALTQRGDFICAGKAGSNFFRNITDE